MRDTCRRCGVDISALRVRRDRQWCGKVCRTYWTREQRRIEARHRRPRCVMCSGPMPYGKSGFVLTARTCSMPCHIKFSNLFQRGKAARG